MPKFQIDMNGKTYEIEAADETALKGAIGKLQEMSAAKPADTGNQKVDASTVYVDEMLFGLPGKAAAGLNALVRAPFTDKTVGEEYRTIRDQYQNARKQYAEDHPIANTAASIGGAVHGGATTARMLENGVATVAPRLAGMVGSSYGGRMAADGASGAVQGGLSAYGHDENVGTGALLGGAAGAIARPVIDAGGAAVNAIGGLVGAGNKGRAQNAIAEALMRSGKSADDVADDLARAAREGQPEYMVADSMGNSGQRMLSGIVRSPGDQRQVIAETLQRRQAGQGDRLANALAEGFNAPDTAAQRAASLEAGRKMLADVNYANARNSAGAVDVTGAIKAVDDVLRPGANKVMNPASGLADDSTDALLSKYRTRMTNGREMLTDFNEVLKLKSDITDEIATLERAGQNRKAGALSTLAKRLDVALETASPDYRAANDAFRAQSRTMEAVDAGMAASSGRMRSADTIEQFNAMQPGEQNAFRAGYVDPLIARVEAQSMSPTTNKARSLITAKTGEEFPAFAIPQRAAKMGDRIAREQRMFETANAALGGSKTADNLADIADMQSFDPTMIGALLSGNIKGAAIQGLTKGINTLQGRNQATRDLIAKALMETGPTRAKAVLADAVARGDKISKTNEAIIKALIAGGASTPQRLLAGQ